MKIPILFNHDHSQPPVGFMDKDGKIKLRDGSGITPEQLVDLDIGYVANKVADDGTVLEAELIELSIIVKK